MDGLMHTVDSHSRVMPIAANEAKRILDMARRMF